MTDKEILAELKTCYELLQDIIDNQYNQLTSTKELEETQDKLSEKYTELYERIKATNDISLYYEEEILIAPHISGDYIDTEHNWITSGDLDFQKWWEDYEFLTKF